MAVDTTPSGPAPGRGTTELSGLDALELAGRHRRGLPARAWSAGWPKLLAVGLALLAWQVVVWTGWRPDYLLPGPGAVFSAIGDQLGQPHFWQALATTMRRAVTGFAIATVIGVLLGIAVARIRPLRSAIGSMITALQTMPSIAWFPLAILLYQLTESAILFVVVLGAAPSIANGVINGVDYVSPVLVRVGRNMGASGLSLYRHVIGPASLPSIVAGLKQGWAFAWRSLMSGELLVILANRPSLGVQLKYFQDQTDAVNLLGTMVVILVIGLLVDALFGLADGTLRRRRGITPGA